MIYISRIKLTAFALLITLLPLFALEASHEIREITPPSLEEAHLGKKILCHRPMRRESPNLSIERIEDKVIANNYGHGGSGWTLGPGSADYVINALMISEHGENLKSDTPLTVVGTGALGFFTAYALLNKDFKNINIVAEKFESLTSHNAGGLIAPVSMDNNPEMQKEVDRIGVKAYKFFKAIALKEHPHFKEGVVIVPTYFKKREDSGLEPYVQEGVMQPAKDVILDFGNGTTRAMVSYDDGIFLDTAKMMLELETYLKNNGVQFIQNKVESFLDLEAKYIFNCAGLGAAELNKDKGMVSIQGHLIMLKNQIPQNLQHMILVYLDQAKTEYGQNVKRSFYMFPKRLPNTHENDVGVIGGTFIEGATKDTPNKKEFEIMLQNAKDFYGIK